MSGDLLQTKLYLPRIRPSLVPRPHLIAKLHQGLDGKLTLISAPAGFGKTTLISSWIDDLRAEQRKTVSSNANSPVNSTLVAWLSFDERDGDLTRFLTYLIAAVQTALPDVGQELLAALQSPQPPPAERSLTALLNQVTAIPNKLLLIFDDFHVVDASAVHQAVTFLLDNMPPNLHLVINTRTIPPLPLPRLRARGQLTEIDQQALRFTESETRILLNDTLQLNLTPTQISALENRTEGWIAGLHMAAISLKNRPDAAQFIDTFSGSHRYIFDYLVDEVLAQQPESVREFLRKTAVLSHLRTDLCDALLEKDAQSQFALEQLEAAHLFITPLDDQREWYRYHAMFADVLHQQLPDDEKRTQHQRAARWFAQQEMLPEAIHHALASHALDEAAQLIQQAAHPTLMRGEHQTLQRWLDALPDERVRSQSKLALYQGWLCFIGGEIGEAAKFAKAANNNLPATVPAVQRGRLDCLRAWVSLHQTGAETAVSLAQSAIHNLGDSDNQFRMLAAMVLGEAHDMMGDTQAAVMAYRDGARMVTAMGDTIPSQLVLLRLAIGLNETGRRREAVELMQQHTRDDGNSLLQLAAGALAFEANEMETAVAHIHAGLKVASQLNIGGVLLYGQLILAQIQLALGNWEVALQTTRQVGDMGREQQSSFYINWATAFAARIQMTYDEMTVEIAISPEKQLLPWQEPTHFIASRQLLAQNRPDEALALLAQLETSARRGGRNRARLTIMLRQALAFQMKHDETKAITLLQKALHLAEPEGYLYAFLDEGEPMTGLLKKALPRLSETAVLTFAGRILTAGGEEPTTPTAHDPLTEREIEILRLIAAGRSNPEIGKHLYLSLNTVKWHIKNIYAKLHVHNRVEATAYASERNLL